MFADIRVQLMSLMLEMTKLRELETSLLLSSIIIDLARLDTVLSELNKEDDDLGRWRIAPSITPTFDRDWETEGMFPIHGV